MRLDLNKIEELEKEFNEIEEKTDELYRERGFENSSVKWYLENIRPLTERQDQIKKEIRIIQATNVNVGDGMSVSPYSDWSAYTIIERRDTPKGFVLKCQRDHAKRIDSNGMSDCQDYEFERNENGGIIEIKWNPIKRWFTCSTYSHVSTGRYEYYDYSF